MEKIDIKIFGLPLGVVFMEKEFIKFSYLPDFLRTPLNPSPAAYPKQEKVYALPYKHDAPFYNLPSFIGDSLPDTYGHEVVSIFLKRKGVDFITPLQQLAYLGENGMGALSFHPSADTIDDTGEIGIEVFEKFSQQNYENKKRLSDFSIEDLKAYRRFVAMSGSAGGARPKAVICRKGNHVLSGLLKKPPEGYHYEILKIQKENAATPFGDFRDHPKLEYIYHQLALKSGINMMPCELLSTKNSIHFTTRRFDRQEDGRKIHLQTYAAINNINYRSFGSNSIDKVFDTMDVVIGADLFQKKEMFRRKVFNIISCNTDDHTKNTSFMMDSKGNWSLSPAYDLTYEPIPTGMPRKHAMWLNGKNAYFNQADIVEAGILHDIGRTPKEVVEMIEEIADSFSEFPTLSKEVELTEKTKKMVIRDVNEVLKDVGLNQKKVVVGKIKLKEPEPSKEEL